MTAPKLAATRPAALTGRVGQGDDNRIHDVTLVQALLGQKRDRKSNRPYLRNHVTGKYDNGVSRCLTIQPATDPWSNTTTASATISP